jgi:hypothetical protein
LESLLILCVCVASTEMPDIRYIVSEVTHTILLIDLALTMSQSRPLALTPSNVVMWVKFWLVTLLGHITLRRSSYLVMHQCECTDHRSRCNTKYELLRTSGGGEEGPGC